MRTIPSLLAAALAAAFGTATAQVTETPRSTAPASTAAQQLNVPPSQRAGGSAQGRADRRLDEADRQFVENAGQSGLAELLASQMAQKRATSADVRRFADRMIQDHTRANAQLVRLARAAGAQVPTEPSLLQRGKLELLERTGREDFDARYLDHFGVDAHDNAIAAFERQVREGQHGPLVTFARETLPRLQEHLRMAQNLQRSLQAGTGASDTRASGNAGTAVQTQSGRVSDTGVAPTAVDQRTPAARPNAQR
jgi:putative membrane protein